MKFFANTLRVILKILIRLVALFLISISFPFAFIWRNRTKSLPRDTSWTFGRELIFSQGIPYWNSLLADFRLDIADKDVLEVGSGNGQWLISLISLGAKSVQGVEPNDDFRSYSNNMLSKYSVEQQVNVINASAECLPFPDESFDLLLCMGVFMFTDQSLAMAEFKRVLRPGGKILISVNGLGYFIMKIKDGIIFSQYSHLTYGISGLLFSLIKWYFNFRLGPTAVNTNEMKMVLALNDFTLDRVWLHNDIDLYPLDHLSFPTNYAFRATKSRS